MSRYRCARTTSTHSPSRRRLSIETLETRTVLSAASSLLDPWADLTVPAVATAPAAFVVRPNTTYDAVAVSFSATYYGLSRMAGLRVAPSALGLQRTRGQATAAKTNPDPVTSVTPQLSTSLLVSTSQQSVLSPTTKTCRPYALKLCKVPLDTGVDPILQCPGLNPAYCMPKPSVTPLAPYSTVNTSGPASPSGTNGT